MLSDIGYPSRNIVKHSAGFKVVEWANWIILFSLPLLKGRLPQSSYRLEGERLLAYLISFHYLLHIGDCIEDFGPYHRFRQFPMERYCEMLIPLDIEESYIKYGKLRIKDGNIISSKWWKNKNDSSRNDYCAAINLTIDDQQEEEIFGQIEYFMIHIFQDQERMFAYV
ncbi:hypothetical protein GLOIN_2v1480212 [Rhizophagus clarus]|uniref:Uncharacterized protein n=1 Tax=Rhizophagus clarus TaxID=94130 RepID=A0A8H3M9N2_9GLOM|nr:hypothetical protein GLOIN_2v1480212 [Rhizophagus clarus]